MIGHNETAFPVVHPDGSGVQYFGLSKRELIAAMAMQGMLASETEASNYGHIGFLAESAVKRADALLEALAKS